MAEYISREEALNLIEHNDRVCHYADERYENVVYATAQTICKVVAEMPASDVQPVKYAKWILFAKDKIGRAFYCSNCRKATTTEDFENTPLEREEYFCSRCGARMDGDTNG